MVPAHQLFREQQRGILLFIHGREVDTIPPPCRLYLLAPAKGPPSLKLRFLLRRLKASHAASCARCQVLVTISISIGGISVLLELLGLSLRGTHQYTWSPLDRQTINFMLVVTFIIDTVLGCDMRSAPRHG
jgi:hypothetical protein